MKLRIANIDDVTSIAEIESDLQGAFAWRINQITDVFLQTESKHQSYINIVAEKKSYVIGYALVKHIFDEAELYIIGVAKDYQRQGIAKELLDYIENELVTLAVEKLFLEVRASNLAALHLYKKVGFTEISIRKNYYHTEDGNGKEDAVIMQKHISNPKK